MKKEYGLIIIMAATGFVVVLLGYVYNDYVYRISDDRYNSWDIGRTKNTVYEFTPKSTTNIQCVYVSNFYRNTGSLQCFEKKAKE